MNQNASLDLTDSLIAAKGLLGWELVHETQDGKSSGIIVETEAYSQEDAASHSFRGITERNKIMFGAAGFAYIYFTYGMHYCFNIVTGPAGHGQAVLIRALEPIDGIAIMKKRRRTEEANNLTNGPAKLVQAMGITKLDYGANLLSGDKLRLEPGTTPNNVIQTTRIGIKNAVNKRWRFYIADNPFVSKK